MENKEWSPAQLLELSGSYWQTCTLHAGLKLDVFTVIGDREADVKELADTLKCSHRTLVPLLNALCAMKLLDKNGDKYSNIPSGKVFLNKKSPQYLGYIMLHHNNMMSDWSNMAQVIIKGKPLRETHLASREELENFLMGMFNMAISIAPVICREIDLKGRKKLLDLGGGPGTYAIHFCMENKGLDADIFDLPGTEPFARATVERFNLSDRINFIPGDFTVNDITGTYDAVWISHILHSMGPDECINLLKKAVSALAPGGILMIQEFILDDDLVGPLFPALFYLNMIVNTHTGMAYSESQIKKMMTDAGLHDIKRSPFKGPNDNGIITGIL